MSKSNSEQPKRAKAAQTASAQDTNAPRRSVWLISSLAALSAAALVGAAFFVFGPMQRPGAGSAISVPAAFVGSEACIGCHKAEGDLWRASQHKHAMDHATEKSVLGDFSDVVFDNYGVRSRFFQKDGRFFVETDGPDGKIASFEVKYTFGLDPLQQYLIEFPDGRLQALSIAWDSRPKEKGGQRWFHLYPDEKIGHEDVLHWTKLNQNWNFMCAECHSTGVRKNYDAAHDRFKTTWAEISVGCEACHGRGSPHVNWAHTKQSWWPFGKTEDRTMGLLARFTERDGISWSLDPKAATATRSIPPATLRKEVETCGLCHARRGQFSENWVPGRSLSETHNVSPLSRGLYHPDGQMLDEVYNYGSFKQSKMFAAGVTCSDCHDPHNAKLRLTGDNVCLQCHSGEKFSAVSHTRHAEVTPPLTCVSCHMPARTYMVVDQRHDHSFRVPRPDISAKLGTPNACTDCHAGKSADWAASAIDGWHGPNRKGFQNYTAGFHAAWNGHPGAAALLAEIAANPSAPTFARAGALAEMASFLSSATAKVAQTALTDADPMVRIGALDMLDQAPTDQVWSIVAPLLSDPVRGVRIRAASLLASVPTGNQPVADREQFNRAADEFFAAQKLNADRPEARAALGNFLVRQGRAEDAEAEFKAALRLSPQHAPAATNLADLYRNLRRDGDGETILRQALAASPNDAGLHHALGLALIRMKRPHDALGEFRTAAELDTGRARYGYVYGVALQSLGRNEDAIKTLEQVATRHPRDQDTLAALVNFNRKGGNLEAALRYAEQLSRIFPEDQSLARLVEELRQKK